MALAVPLFLHRFNEHALRTAKRANGAQTTFTNPVVNSPTRDAEKLSSLINGDAAAELRLKRHDVVREHGCGVHQQNNLRHNQSHGRCHGSAIVQKCP